MKFCSRMGKHSIIKATQADFLGAGFNYRIMPRTWLNVDGTYSKGFTDVTRNTVMIIRIQPYQLMWA